MVSSIDSSSSALNAFSKRMKVTANNVANVSTDGFKKSRTTIEEGPSGGVRTNVSEVNTPGYFKQTTVDGRLQETETSNVDLAEELTDTITTKTGYQVNQKTIQTQNEMLGTLLDTIG